MVVYLMLYCMAIRFLFQAEDGIRDLVRSRGLGDVYKRQPEVGSGPLPDPAAGVHIRIGAVHRTEIERTPITRPAAAVSYTHLTLPTSDLV